MDRVYSTHDKGEKFVEHFSWEKMNEINDLKVLGVGMSIILKWITE
jgi:hypothetical protein